MMIADLKIGDCFEWPENSEFYIALDTFTRFESVTMLGSIQVQRQDGEMRHFSHADTVVRLISLDRFLEEEKKSGNRS